MKFLSLESEFIKPILIEIYSNMKQVLSEQHEKLKLNDTTFTTHSIKHSENIINTMEWFVNGLILNEKLTSEEWAVLYIAALLHDYGMKDGPKYRKVHSELSYWYIKTECNKPGSALNSLENKYKGIAEAIAIVCYSHTDSSDKCYRINDVPTLFSLETEGSFKVVRLKLLAGVLRLCDELDSTQERISKGVNIEWYKNASERMGTESLSHWRTNELILSITKNIYDKRIIDFNINDEALSNSKNKLYTSKHDINLILDRVVKIENELEQFNKNVINEYSECACTYNILNVVSSNHLLNNCIKSRYSLIDYYFNKSECVDLRIKNLNRPFERDQISDFIISNRRIIQGHFRLTKDLSCRDWIYASELLNNDKLNRIIVHSLTNSILKAINTSAEMNKDALVRQLEYGKPLDRKIKEQLELDSNPNDLLNQYTIVGFGINGMKIGAKIAHYLGLKFTYIVPSSVKGNHDISELTLDKNGDGKIILITDVISTGESLKDAISIFKQCYEVENDPTYSELILTKNMLIFSVLFRKSHNERFYNLLSKNLEKYRNNIYFLNSDFNLELCSKDRNDCVYIKNKDYGINCKKYISFFKNETISTYPTEMRSKLG